MFGAYVPASPNVARQSIGVAMGMTKVSSFCFRNLVPLTNPRVISTVQPRGYMSSGQVARVPGELPERERKSARQVTAGNVLLFNWIEFCGSETR